MQNEAEEDERIEQMARNEESTSSEDEVLAKKQCIHCYQWEGSLQSGIPLIVVNGEGRIVCRHCISNEDPDIQEVMKTIVDEVIEERDRNRERKPSREQLKEVNLIFQQATGLQERCFKRCDMTKGNWQRCSRICIQEVTHWGACLCIKHFNGNPFTRPNEGVASASVKMIKPADEGIEGLTPEEREEHQRLLQQKAARDARIRELEEERRELERQLREDGIVSDEEEEIRQDEHLSIEEAVQKRLERWGFTWDDEDQTLFLKKFQEECEVEMQLRTLKQEVKEKAKELRRIYHERKPRKKRTKENFDGDCSS